MSIDIEPIEDLQDVRWGFDRISQFEFARVGSMVPVGFEQYARIFHPGSRVVGQRRVRREWSNIPKEGLDFFQLVSRKKKIPESIQTFEHYVTEKLYEPVTWSEMAAYTGKRTHALMQWEKISSPTMDGKEVERPAEGTIPPTVSAPLQELLLKYTESSTCFMGVWQGWGGPYIAQVPKTKSIDAPPFSGREWDLFRVPLINMDFKVFGEQDDQTANIFWAEDRSWWLNNDIDLDTTYIGGDVSLIEAVLASKELEVWPADVNDWVTLAADTINDT